MGFLLFIGYMFLNSDLEQIKSNQDKIIKNQREILQLLK